MPDILIVPKRSTTDNPQIFFTGSVQTSASIRMEVLPEGQVSFLGKSGSLFGVTDSLVGSLMSVNDISGIPILEVFSDDKVVMGKFNQNTLVVTGSNVGIGKSTPNSAARLDVSGSVFVTGSVSTTGSLSVGGIVSIFGGSPLRLYNSANSEFASISLNASNRLLINYPIDLTGNLIITGSITGSGGIGLLAGGSNQNVTLTPSGTGVIAMGGTGTRSRFYYDASNYYDIYGDYAYSAGELKLLSSANNSITLSPNGGVTIGTIAAIPPANGLVIRGGTVSTSTTTGALIVSGGLSVGEALWVGNGINTLNAKNIAVRNADNSAIAVRMYADSSNYGYIDTTSNTELRLQVGSGTKVAITNTGTVSAVGNVIVSGSLNVTGSVSSDGINGHAIFGGVKRLLIGYDNTTDVAAIASIQTGVMWKPLALQPISGQVLIGKTNANATFDVNGNSIITGSLTVLSNTGVIIARASNPDQALTFTGGDGGGISSLTARYQLNLNSNDVSYPMTFQIAGSEKMRITSAGNVAIGKTIANAVLDVNGGVFITGSLNISSSTIIDPVAQVPNQLVPEVAFCRGIGSASGPLSVLAFGSSARLGLLRGVQDGSGTVQWRFGNYSGTTFVEGVRFASSTSGLSVGGVEIYHSTPSTSTTTGALIVSGGLGVGGAIYAGTTASFVGPIFVGSSSDVYVSRAGAGVLDIRSANIPGTTARLDVTGTATASIGFRQSGVRDWFISAESSELRAYSLTAGSTFAFTSGSLVAIRDSTPSTSTRTGALIVSGGLGVGGATNIGGNVIITGSLTLGTYGASLRTTLGTLTFYSASFTEDGTIGAISQQNIGTGNNYWTGRTLVLSPYSSGARVQLGGSAGASRLTLPSDSEFNFSPDSFARCAVLTPNLIIPAPGYSYISGSLAVGYNATLSEGVYVGFNRRANGRSELILTSDTVNGALRIYRDGSVGGVNAVSTIEHTGGTGGLNIVTGLSSIFFSTSTVERMVINSIGNVGIGTSLPNYKLHVTGSINFDGSTLITGSVTVSGSTAITGSLTVSGTSRTTSSFNGPVVIGKLTPINATLDVNGNTIITGSLTVTNGIQIQGVGSDLIHPFLLMGA